MVTVRGAPPARGGGDVTPAPPLTSLTMAPDPRSNGQPHVLDLDARRGERAEARAAAREGSGATMPVRFGGKQIAELPAELPLSVLEPFITVGFEIVAPAMRQAVDLFGADEAESRKAAGNLLIDILAGYPDLPQDLLNAVREAALRLLGGDGYAAFIAAGPALQDAAELVKGVVAWYGMDLGKSLPQLPSSTGGETSNPTSSGGTGSTPAAPGPAPGTPVSSAPAG